MNFKKVIYACALCVFAILGLLMGRMIVYTYQMGDHVSSIIWVASCIGAIVSILIFKPKVIKDAKEHVK